MRAHSLFHLDSVVLIDSRGLPRAPDPHMMKAPSRAWRIDFGYQIREPLFGVEPAVPPPHLPLLAVVVEGDGENTDVIPTASLGQAS